MTAKRTKAVASLDLVLPVAPHYRTDPQVLKDIEKMRTNVASRWAKYDISHSPLGNNNYDDSSKIAALARPKLEILRANSPTLKRLIGARTKLEKYAASLTRTNSASRQSARSARETPYPSAYEKPAAVLSKPLHEKQSSRLSKSVYAPSQAPQQPIHALKPSKSQSSLDHAPLDKITYEKTWTRNGNMKQKCSLEIWLPKPVVDDDDANTSKTTTPRHKAVEKLSQTMPVVKSRRSSVAKITATSTITNVEVRPSDDTSLKKSEPTVVPRIYRYEDYIVEIPEERPRSSKSVTTVKSDGTASIRSIRRQKTRLHTGRQSISTNNSEEILRFGTVEVPSSGKKSSTNIKSASTSHETQPSVKSSNPSMINELMHKYSLIKKNHQELTQARLHLEKPNTDFKTSSIVVKEGSSRVRPPPIPDSTLLISSDHPTVSVKKLFLDNVSTRPPTEHNTSSSKLLDRRSAVRKQSHPEIYPQLRVFSMTNQQQNRQPSAALGNAAYFPNVNGKKSEEALRILQRSKTLDVALDAPHSANASTRAPNPIDNLSSNRVQRTTNGFVEQSSTHVSNRAPHNLYTEQRKQPPTKPSVFTNPQQNLPHPPPTTQVTNAQTKKVLIHFNHSNNGNMDRNYLVPE